MPLESSETSRQFALGSEGFVKKLVYVWKVKNGIAEGRDVALASKKQMIAMTGGMNFINERFVDVTVAVLDKRGCAVYSEKVHGILLRFRGTAGGVAQILKTHLSGLGRRARDDFSDVKMAARHATIPDQALQPACRIRRR